MCPVPYAWTQVPATVVVMVPCAMQLPYTLLDTSGWDNSRGVNVYEWWRSP